MQNIAQSTKIAIAEAVDAIRNGQFVAVNGYTNQHGEVADFIVTWNANYEAGKARANAALEKFRTKIAKALARGSDVKVKLPTFYMWKKEDGSLSNRKSNGASIVPFKGEVLTGPELLATLNEIEIGVNEPKKVTNNFQSVNDSVQSLRDDAGVESLYLRNVLRIRKTVRVEGVYETQSGDPKASARETVAKDAVKRLLNINQYVTFKLEPGNFESLSFAGTVLDDDMDDATDEVSAD